MSDYIPDDWVILRMTSDQEVHHRILCSWAGGYTQGSSWKISSGIEGIEESEDGRQWVLPQSSGSVYALWKTGERMSGIMSGIYHKYSTNAPQGMKMERISWEDFVEEYKA